MLMVGAGAAGVAVAKILMDAGVTSIVACDRFGAIHTGRDDYEAGSMNAPKRWLAENTNTDRRDGISREVIEGTDLFVGLSGPGIISASDLEKMNADPFVFAMANPNPEVRPEEAAPHVRVMATGRSDYPNQINNVLAFPGVFRGALDARATAITEEMKLAAARGIASVVHDDELDEDYIIPSVFNRDVAREVANAVRDVAERSAEALEEQPTRRSAPRRQLVRVAVTGATGTIGSALVRELRERGDEVTALSRDEPLASPGRAGLAGPEPEPPPAEALRGHDAVVHLIGEPIAQRWSDDAKREIRESRVLGTRNLVAGLRRLPRASARACSSRSRPPATTARAATSASTRRAPPGDDFLARVVRRLGGRGRAAEELGVRVALTRTGVVLSRRAARSRRCCPSSSSASAARSPAGASTSRGCTSTTSSARCCSRSTTRPRAARQRDRARAGHQQGVLARARAGARPPAFAPGAGLAVKDALRRDGDDRHHRPAGGPEPARELGYELPPRALEDALRDGDGANRPPQALGSSTRRPGPRALARLGRWSCRARSGSPGATAAR